MGAEVEQDRGPEQLDVRRVFRSFGRAEVSADGFVQEGAVGDGRRARARGGSPEDGVAARSTPARVRPDSHVRRIS